MFIHLQRGKTKPNILTCVHVFVLAVPREVSEKNSTFNYIHRQDVHLTNQINEQHLMPNQCQSLVIALGTNAWLPARSLMAVLTHSYLLLWLLVRAAVLCINTMTHAKIYSQSYTPAVTSVCMVVDEKGLGDGRAEFWSPSLAQTQVD